MVRFDADATKTGVYREVPLHDDLINQRFLEYVVSRGKRPLFYEPSRMRGGRDAGAHFRKAGERLAEWIRSDAVGIKDENVAPNHGWRHRFSSLARHVDMHIDVQNIVQGHAGDKVASDYGDAWVKTAYREIMKIPRYDIDTTRGRRLAFLSCRAKRRHGRMRDVTGLGHGSVPSHAKRRAYRGTEDRPRRNRALCLAALGYTAVAAGGDGRSNPRQRAGSSICRLLLTEVPESLL